MSTEDRKVLLLMLVDVAKAMQNSRAYPPHDDTIMPDRIPDQIRDVIHRNPAWCDVVRSGFTIEDVFNAFYKN
jgi:hypothetical protein